MRHRWQVLFAAGAILLVVSLATTAQEQPKQSTLTIVDGTGKEHIVDRWKITVGTKLLGWMTWGPVEQLTKSASKKGPPYAGPEALEFTEGKTPPLKKRVISYIPLANIRSIDFQDKKNTISVRVVVSEQEADDVILHGVTGYPGANSIIIDVVTELGELGKGTLRFQHGVGRGLSSVRFPSPRPLEPLSAGGRLATIKQVAKNQATYTAIDLEALYSFSGVQRTYALLFFKDSVRLDLTRVQKLTSAGPGGFDFDVTLKSGQQSSLTLLERPKSVDGKAEMVLEGLVGRFAGGYRFFPLATVGELVFEDKVK